MWQIRCRFPINLVPVEENGMKTQVSGCLEVFQSVVDEYTVRGLGLQAG
jgi:hypothetical protein